MKQHLVKSYGLNEKQLADIRQLESACNQFEALTIKLNWSTLQKRPDNEVNDFLYYADDQLIGSMALFTFNQNEAEVSAMVHPAYRRQGLFKQLLAAAQAELEQRYVPDFLFICERNSVSGGQCMQAIKARYDFSEYKMALRPGAGLLPAVSNLKLRPAVAADLDELARMDGLCFNVPAAIAMRHLEQDLGDERRRIRVAMVGEERVGKVGVSVEGDSAFIFGLCVLSEQRSKGYGRSILTRTVAELLAENRTRVSLEVACENEKALSLYQRAGFEVVTSYDYYRRPVLLNSDK